MATVGSHQISWAAVSLDVQEGVENKATDALSRNSTNSPGELVAVSTCVPAWLTEVVAGYALDESTKKLLTQLSVKGATHPKFHLHDGLLRYMGRVWVGTNIPMQLKIMQAMYDSAIGGHSRFQVTYSRIRKLFAWPGMKQGVKDFVSACSICKQAKSEHVKYSGLLQPLPIQKQAWQMVPLDFIEGLPRSSNYNCIMVVMDKFSRYAHFVPLAHPFTAFHIAQAYIINVFKLHGLPQSLISDRDRIFTSTLWRELFRLVKTQLRMRSYHPQTDGQTERVNQCLETYLRCFVHTCPRKWSEWLAFAEFWYNTSYHSTLGKSPFEVLYGHSPCHFGIVDSSDCTSPELSSWLHDWELMTKLLRQHLHRACQRMKVQADRKRSERSFSVSDWVI